MAAQTSPATNDTSKMVGRSVVLEYCLVPAAGENTRPVDSDWKPAGAMRTKAFDFKPNTVTSEADDEGGFPETLVTNSEFSLSGEGEFRKKDKTTEIGINALVDLYVKAITARKQPRVWVRLNYGSIVVEGKLVITELSTEAPTNDLVTFSVGFGVGESSTLSITVK